MNPSIRKLEALLELGQDTPLLRFGLGNAYLQAGDPGAAAHHLEAAVAQDPNYSAAWKLYARALAENGRSAEAISAYRQGIRVAEARGDIQAAKEMGVFLRRLERLGSE